MKYYNIRISNQSNRNGVARSRWPVAAKIALDKAAAASPCFVAAYVQCLTLSHLQLARCGEHGKLVVH
jgi:hypothetical protein